MESTICLASLTATAKSLGCQQGIDRSFGKQGDAGISTEIPTGIACAEMLLKCVDGAQKGFTTTVCSTVEEVQRGSAMARPSSLVNG